MLYKSRCIGILGDEAANEINENVLHRLTHLGAVYTDVLNYSGWSMVGDFNWREGGDDENVPNLLMFVDGVTIFPDHIMRTHERGGCLDLVGFLKVIKTV